jgi:hypothetical protein
MDFAREEQAQHVGAGGVHEEEEEMAPFWPEDRNQCRNQTLLDKMDFQELGKSAKTYVLIFSLIYSFFFKYV